MDQDQPIDRILRAIEQATGSGRRETAGWRLKCPAHPDRDPSLSLGENAEHHALLWCGGGCDTPAVLAAVGLTMRDLYPIKPDDKHPDPIVATYQYVDEAGTLLYQVLRTAAKKFRQRRPDPYSPGQWIYNLQDTRRVLYRLPMVIQAVSEGQAIYVVEGEKDVHAWEARGHVATTNAGGAGRGKWRTEYSEYLRGADVIVVADLDQAGQGLAHARAVALDVGRLANSVTLCGPAGGKDSTDHFNLGFEPDALTLLPIIAPAGSSELAPEVPGGHADPLPEPVSPAEPPTRNPIRLTPASAFKIKPVRWLWQDRMPLGEITLIPGREGIGKSTFLAWMAAAITNGNLPGKFYGEPRAVLYAAAEDAWTYTIAPRMIAAGANLELVQRIDVVEDEGPEQLNLPLHCRWLPEVAEDVKAVVLMCDPIMSLVSDTLNTNRSQELRKALEPLKHAAEAGGFAVPALVHFNKTRDTDLLSMISGSRAWAEVARAVVAIAKDQETGDCVVSQQKNNLGRTDLPNLTYTLVNVELETEDGEPARVGRLVWGDETDTSAEEVLQRKPSGGGDRGRSAAVNAVLDFLDEQEVAVSPRQVADGCPNEVNHSNAKQILHRLATAGRVERVGTGLYKAVSPAPEPAPRPPDGDRRARARVTPSVSPSPVPPQIRGGGGGDTVTRNGDGDSDKRGKTLSPQIACKECFGPLDDVNGTGYHPMCEPDAQ